MLIEQSGDSLMVKATAMYDRAILAGPATPDFSSAMSNAASLFTNAGNAFKLEKKWSDAGDAFYKAGDVYALNTNEDMDAVRCFQQSFIAFKKCDDIALTLQSFNRLAQLLKRLDLFAVLAKDEADFAKYLSHNGSLAEAADHYQKSADYYDMEDFPASRDRALIPLATIQASLGKYLEAALLFERVAKSCSTDKLTVFGFRSHLLNALLCRIASGQNAKDLINYDTYDGWMYSNEWKFQYELLAIMEGGLEVNIGIIASPHSRILNLNDPWKVALFDKIASLYPPKTNAAPSLGTPSDSATLHI